MTTLHSLAAHPYASAAGWVVLLALWETTSIALLLAGWRWLRPGAPARAQYRLAGAALMASSLVVAATSALVFAPPQKSVAARVVLTGVTVDKLPVPSAATALPLPAATPVADLRGSTTAGWAGLVWLIGVTLLLIRLVVGLGAATRLRMRAVPCGNVRLAESVECLRAAQGVRRSVLLLESDQVGVPVVVGLRHPAIVLPPALTALVPPEALESILAHEVAHVRRGDYVANLLQRVVECLLFFSPGIRWISARVSEAREFCCDDDAIRHGGADASRYARGLAALAAAVGGGHSRTALAAIGPPLTIRLRRILQEGHRPPLAPSRWLAFATALVAVVVSGVPVTTFALDISREFVAQARALDSREPLAVAGGTEPPGPSASSAAQPLRVTPSQTATVTSPTSTQRPGAPPPGEVAPRRPNTWQISSSAHFDVTYLPSLADRVDSITADAERAYEKVSADLLHELSLRPLLVLFGTRVDLEQAVTSGDVPGDRDRGLAVRHQNILVPLDMPPGQVGGQLAHELGHAFTFDIVPSSARHDFPRWIEEGLADFARGEWAETDLAVLQEMVRTQTLPTLLRLPAAAAGDERVVRILGHAAIDFLVSRAGRGQVRQLLLWLRLNGADPVGGYLTSVGLPATEFERAFRDYLNARFVSAG